MTDMIVVGIITATGTVTAALINSFFKREKRADNKSPIPKVEDNAKQQVIEAVELPSPVQNLKSLPSVEIPKNVVPEPQAMNNPNSVKQITLNQIRETIDSAPPFHQDTVRKDFIGIRVRWNLELTSISHFSNGKIGVFGNSLDGARWSAVQCTAPREEIGAFVVAKRGWKFVVEGCVEQVNATYIDLKDCKFSDLHSFDPASGSGSNHP